MSLEDVKGLGETKIKLLKEAGINTLEKLSITSHVKISNILKCSSKVAKKLIDQAKELTENKIILSTAKEILEERKKTVQRIPTGSTSLDSIIGGGIETNAITGLTGEFGSGKTQICYSLVCNTKKYLNRKSAWIETEPQTYRSERILEIAKNRGIELDLNNDVFVIESKYINSCDSQYKAYELIEKTIKKGHDIGLLVIDSFNAQFRTSYFGREMLPERSQDVAHHIGFLQYLASKYNMAIVLTIQVMGIPDSGMQLGAIKKIGIRTMPVGPHILKHAINYWISLDQVSSSDNTYKAIIADGPVPRNECIFKIDKNGISDISLSRGRI
jgi:DNA repair protein RadA